MRPGPARRPAACPAARPRRPGTIRASGSSAPATPGGTPRSAPRTPRRPRLAPGRSGPIPAAPQASPSSCTGRIPILYVHRAGGGLGGSRTPSFPALRCIHPRRPGGSGHPAQPAGVGRARRCQPATPARRRTEMGKIVISTNMSLDGVVQDPNGGEGFNRGGWFVQQGSKDLEEWGKIEHAEALRTAALLLGRRSEEWFGTRWASRPGEWADRLHGLPKYVAASTLPDPKWTNGTVLTGNVIDEVTRLKQQVDGDIVVYASY